MNAVEVKKEIEQQYWLLEALPVAALISRREDGQVLYANERFAALAGKPPAELVGHVTPDFYYDPAERTALLATLQERGLVQDYEIRGRRLGDGSLVWLSLVIQPVTYQGEAAYLTTLMDITEHKQAEIALTQSESQYRVLAENIQDGVFIIQNAKMIFANQAFADIVGYTVEEIIGMEFTRLIAPEDLPKVAESYRRRQAGEPVPPAYEWRMLRKDGVTRVDVNMTVGLVQLGGQVASLGTVKDITERKRAEAERERYTRQLSVAAEIAARVQSILDPDELLQAVIPLIKERFGLYYVHVYTLEGETLELRAGYGEPGRIMVAQGHRIPLSAEQSLVARAARTQVPVLVNDVTAEPDFLPNPLLPQTKSEVAVPAIAGGKVLGVFDVQHDTPGYFTEADLDVFRTLAGQIAVALENARLFEAQRQAEATVRESQRRLTTLMGNLAGMVYRMLNRPDWPAEFVSEGSLALTGYAPEALMLGGEISFGDLIYPEDQNAVWETVQAALQAHQPYQATYRIVHRDGTIRWVWEQGRGIEDEEGNVVALEGLITDITDRVQAEAALHENEQRFRALIENSSDLITIVNPEGWISYQSPSLKRILGYEPEELIGRSVVEFIPPETVPGIAALLAGIGQQPGAVVHAEYIFRHKDGSWRTMEGSAQASTVAGIAGIVVNSRDVTERKAAEQALRESEEKFRVLADNIAVGIFVHQDGIIKYLGHEAARLLGYSDPAEVAGRSILDLIHPDERERVGTIARQRVAGEAVPDTYESRLLRKDGTAMDVMMYSSIISYEGRPATQGAFLDITERKQAEKAMQLDDIRQRALLRLSQMAEAPLKEILDYAIEEFGHITDSPISYLAFVNADESVMTMHAWSGGAMAQCKIIDKPIVYPVVTTGLWGEAIRQRRAIITNDYDEPNPWKRGYPQGHVEVKRHMNAPIFDGEHIVMVVGVGNKPEDYTDSDVQQLTLLATGLWQVIQRKQADEERERYTQRLSVAAEIAARVQAILDPDELLQAVIPLIKERFGLYYVHVYTLEGEALKLRAGYGEPGRIMVERGHSIPLAAERSLVARAARTQEVVVVEDVTTAPDFLPNPLLPETRSEVAVPAIAGGQVIGVFDVQHDVPDYFTEADLDVFRALAGQIATAFQNAQLYTEAQLRLRVMQALGEAQTEAEVLDTLIREAAIFPATVTLHLMDTTAEELTAVLVRSAGAEGSPVAMDRSRFTVQNFPLLEAVGRDRPLVIADAKTDPRLNETVRQWLVQHGAISVALLPMVVGEEWLGMLSVAATTPGYFDGAKLALYRALMEEGASALLAAQLRERAAEAASRFQGLVNSALVGIFRTTPAGQVVAANPAMLRILGFDSVAAINEVGLLNLYVEPQERQRLLEALAQGPVTDFEVLFRRADGSVITIALSGRLVYDAAGQPEYLDGTFEDVTERKRAEAAVRESEQRFRGFIEQSFDGILMIDEQGRVVESNDAAAKIIGLTSEELRDKYFWDVQYHLFPVERQTPETYERLKQLGLEMGRTGQSPTFNQLLEGAYTRPDGTSGFVQQVNFPIQTERGFMMGAVLRDVTEQRAQQAERERFAQRLSVAAEIAARVQVILDPDELLQAVIPLIKERFGLYYVHVYTLEGEALKLRAGYGEPGRIMVERGHSIPLAAERSLVARAARTQEVVVVEDVTTAPDFLPNPLLPETRSEVAVPAIAGGQVIGVFDVQHDVPDYFTEADLDVFRALAGQIATAFQNAQLYTEAQNNRAFYESIINNLPVGVWAVDQTFRPLLVNPAGRTMMGREIEDEHGQAYVEAYDVINVNTGQLYKETDLPLVKAVTQGGTHVATDAGVRWPDGTVVPMLINAAPLVDAQGQQTGGVVIFMDATEQKKAQAAAEASAARNRALLQTVPDMLFVFDRNGIFLDYKAEAGQELLAPPELFLGRKIIEVLPPSLAEQTLTYLRQVLATGQPITYEYQAPLGETVHSYEARMSRVGTDQVLALVRDITERKRAEERIQRSELLLRTVFNSVYDGIFLHTAEGAIVDVNDKILEMYGVSREEATRLSIADDYSSPDNPLDQLGVLWQQVMAGHPQLFEWKAKRPHDGTTFDAEVFLRRITLGGRDMVLANVRDITERKQAEAAVAGERDFSNALINSLPVIFYLYDQAGSLVRWNRRYEEVLGYTPAEMSQVKVLDTIAEQDRALIVARLTEVFTTGYAEAEAHLLSRAGRQVPYLVTGTRLAVGDQVYLVGAGIDLTERKRAEAQRERFVTQLSTAAEISAQVGAILDTDELLDEVIPLLKERFDLYHVHFYVMDEARQELVLRAGYGQVGRIMRQQGFKITLDQEQSLVARAARTRQIALANDVTQDPDFMPNLLLPDTRAEVAVPAMIGDRLLGVFDVQSDQADYFTESDLDVYRTLAGQIANAFQSARLFEQQRQAEAAQREAAEKIRAMFDAMTEGITVTNMMGKIEDLNEATLRLYGYSGRDDLLGRSSMQLFTRPFWSKAAESVRRALETGTSQTAEYRMVRRDGSEFEAEMNAALLRDATGAPSGFVSIIRDITARKRAEEERARLTAQLRTAADISTQVASILDPQALFSRVVSLIKERFDIYHVQVYVVDEETQELVLQAGYGEPGRVMVARGHRIPLNTERSLVARAARTREVVVVDDVTKAPDHLPNPLLPLTRSEVAVPAIYGDRVLGVFDVQDDEPARFGMAELDVFRTLAGQIATAFQNAGYVEELQHVAERFRELDRLKSEFLANMSHELRTPLNSIIGYAEVLLMGIDGELEGDTLEDVKAIHENGQHLLSMINDVLDLAKIEAGRMVLKMEEVEVDQLLDEVKSSGTGLLRKYQRTEVVELRISSEPNLPLLHADRIRLNQVLNNLISNAMKFTEHGYVQVRAYRSDPWVCIEVADSGIGIPANQLEQIFEKFRQVDGSSKRRAEGTGLGLAITRYLVEMHGGSIEVSSELGKGSVFTVRLPIQTAPADPEGGAG